MLEVTLEINTPQDRQTATIDGKLSVGRTNLADLALPDASLSRVHATFERHGDEIWVYDENSLNGTFVNGEQVSANGFRLQNGDEVWLGSNTKIYVRFQTQQSKVQSPKSKVQSQPESQKPKAKSQKPKAKIPPVLTLAGISIFGILALAIAAILVVNFYDNSNKNKGKQRSEDIQVEVINPITKDLNELNLDELYSFFDVQEEIDASNLEDVKATETEVVNPTDPNAAGGETLNLNVTRAFWEEQKAKALAPRSGATGISPPGLSVPKELHGDGVIKQKAKLAELINVLNYKQPMDFGDLAQKRLAKELVELPMATEGFYLEVGSSAGEEEFQAFEFGKDKMPILSGSAKYEALQKLAANFSGQVYDLNNGSHRKQMRIRLLRMFHPRALPILKELGEAYRQKFNRPLRVTSLTRSMDYQIALNKVNPNSFPVRGPGSLPPHTSGCAFDLGRKHMSVEEQNFVMAKLAEMENRGVLDGLIEYNVNACFHTFIYPDGKPPKL